MRLFITRKLGMPPAAGRSWPQRLRLGVSSSAPAVCGAAERNPAAGSDDNGFFGWHFHAPFDTSEVKTVAIFFKSNVFRRDLEKQLAEAVIKEINLRTPYRVVANHEEADSLLDGHDHLRRQEPGRRGPDQPAARAQRVPLSR